MTLCCLVGVINDDDKYKVVVFVHNAMADSYRGWRRCVGITRLILFWVWNGTIRWRRWSGEINDFRSWKRHYLTSLHVTTTSTTSEDQNNNYDNYNSADDSHYDNTSGITPRRVWRYCRRRRVPSRYIGRCCCCVQYSWPAVRCAFTKRCRVTDVWRLQITPMHKSIINHKLLPRWHK